MMRCRLGPVIPRPAGRRSLFGGPFEDSPSSRRLGGPSRMDFSNAAHHSSPSMRLPPIVGPSTATQLGRSTSSKGLGTSAASVTSSNGKGNAKKQRPRKFVCDICSFGFYTNSDMQKVSCILRSHGAVAGITKLA